MKKQMLVAAAAVTALGATAPSMALAQSGNPLGSLFSCSNPGANNRTGAIIGGIAGAALGSQVSKNERTLGAVAGAALGAVAGNYVGCRMQPSSQARAEDALETALNTGRSQDWRDARTGAYGRFDIVDARYGAGYGSSYGSSSGASRYGDTRYGDRRYDPRYGDTRYGAPYAGEYSSNVAYRDLRFAPGVARLAANRISADEAIYISPGRVNLRAAPVAGAAVVARTMPGEELTVAGRTADGWLLVHNDGYVRGYVNGNVLRRRGAEAYAANTLRGDCRLVRQTISVAGYPQDVQQFSACRDSYGQWRVQPA